MCAAATAEHKTEAPGLSLMKWLKDNGAPQDKVELRTLEVQAAGDPSSCCCYNLYVMCL